MSNCLDTLLELQGFYRIHYLELPSNYVKPSIPYQGFSLTYIDKGTATVTFDNQPVEVQSGEGFFLPPHADNHMFITERAANIYILVFACDSELLAEISSKVFPINGIIRSYLKLILKEAKFAYINDLRIYDYPELIENSNGPLGAKQMLKNYTESLLIEIIRQHQENFESKYSELIRETRIMQNIDTNYFFEQIVTYLEKHIDEPLSLEQISADNFTNTSKIQKVFRECANEGIISFFQKMKIEKAKTLIRETSMNFTEISELLSFSSVHHFSKKFKQLVKMSPSAYQRFIK
ncbi:MAG: helix-turn-helix transcriptional regulator [Clostridiales bacterium]|nr:helix-turn-helix transcriptional regulator [Clostridiales bacterium]